MPPILESLLPFITILIAVVFILGIVAVILSGKKSHTANLPYEKVTHLFTPAERSFLGVLDHVIDSDYRVFGKVRCADVLRVLKGLPRSDWQQACLC